MNHAAKGITTASVSAYADVSHCTVVSSTLMCCMIDGSAGESSVWFKTTSTAPASSTITMRFCSFVMPKVSHKASLSFERAEGSAVAANGLRYARFSSIVDSSQVYYILDFCQL